MLWCKQQSRYFGSFDFVPSKLQIENPCQPPSCGFQKEDSSQLYQWFSLQEIIYKVSEIEIQLSFEICLTVHIPEIQNYWTLTQKPLKEVMLQELVVLHYYKTEFLNHPLNITLSKCKKFMIYIHEVCFCMFIEMSQIFISILRKSWRRVVAQ